MRFNRSKLVFSLALLAGTAVVLGKLPKGMLGNYWLLLVGVGVPLSLAFLSHLKERGFLTWGGLLSLAILAAQVGVGLYLLRAQQAFLTTLLYVPPWIRSLGALLNGGRSKGVPLAIVLVTVCAVLYIVVRYALRPSAMAAGFLWAMAACLLAMYHHASEVLMPLYLAAAGVILTAALVESSRSMAYDDELTGLPARRALNEDLAKLGRTYTLAMVDIDHFKKFNDTYGHDVGDQVLRMAARKLGQVKGGGKAFRYGGEEFTIVFPGKNTKQALEYLEQVRQAIEQADFSIRNKGQARTKTNRGRRSAAKKVAITVSIGAAERTAANKEPQKVIKAADKALYRAKAKGRNCTMLAAA